MGQSFEDLLNDFQKDMERISESDVDANREIRLRIENLEYTLKTILEMLRDKHG